MRVISQDGSVNVPYDQSALYQSATNLWAVVIGHEFLIGSYDTPDEAKLALESITYKGSHGYLIGKTPKRGAVVLHDNFS